MLSKKVGKRSSYTSGAIDNAFYATFRCCNSSLVACKAQKLHIFKTTCEACALPELLFCVEKVSFDIYLFNKQIHTYICLNVLVFDISNSCLCVLVNFFVYILFLLIFSQILFAAVYLHLREFKRSLVVREKILE